MKILFKIALLLTWDLPIYMCGADQSGLTVESLSTNAISRVSVSEESAVVELAQDGWWLSLRHTDNPSGWGKRLLEPQQSVFVTNRLAITLPDWRAFDLENGNPRHVIRSPIRHDVVWGKAKNGLAIGLKVNGRDVIDDQLVRLETYLQNTSEKTLRVFACRNYPHRVFAPSLQVIGPNGKVIKGVNGKRPAGIGACTHTEESDWPVLQPGEILGPLHLKMFTSDRLPIWADLWFDCSHHGKYQVSLEYPPHGIGAPARLTSTWEGGPPSWQGVASSGTVNLSKP